MSKYSDVFEDFQLDNKQKIKLVELILLISSILTFKLPNDLIWAFMMVLLSSIVYWIVLQKDTKRPIDYKFIIADKSTISAIRTWLRYIVPMLISFFFSLVLDSALFNGLKLSDTPILTISGFLFIIYFIATFLVLWIALSADLKNL